MHQSAWLKAIINCHGVWNVEEWGLWRNWIVYLFTVLFLIFSAYEQNQAFFTRITHDLLHFFFFWSLVCSGVSWDVHEVFCYSAGHRLMCRFTRYRLFVMAVQVPSRRTRWHQANMQKGLMYQQCEAVWVQMTWQNVFSKIRSAKSHVWVKWRVTRKNKYCAPYVAKSFYVDVGLVSNLTIKQLSLICLFYWLKLSSMFCLVLIKVIQAFYIRIKSMGL